MAIDEIAQVSERGAAQAGGGRVTELTVTGMTCGNCARHVTQALQGVAGVKFATVSLDARQATVRWSADTEPRVPELIRAVEEEGYGATILQAPTHGGGERLLSGWRLNLLLGLPVTAVLMAGEWALGWGPARWFQWFSFVAAGVVQVFAGARFYRGAWSQLKAGTSNMDTLVALGSTTAFAYSTWALLAGHGGHVYFMEAAAIISLISFGHWLESRVSARASSALRQLLKLAPDKARQRLPDGREVDTPVTDLQPDHVVVLRPGDRVPTDGTVIEGESAADESMLTGESAPADKSPGSLLFAGTLNVNGRLLMRVTATGDATALSHIIAAVQRAQNSRANIQRLGDRVSAVFVPVVVTIALAAALWWGLAYESAVAVHNHLAHFLWFAHLPEGTLAAAFITAAAVLIIACPCAMGLATPAALMASSNAAAQRGILIRDGVALEKAGQVTAVIFDKTGTLTAGRMSVAKVWTPSGITEPDTFHRLSGSVPEKNGEPMEHLTPGVEPARSPILLAAALARHSKHPVSEAVARLGEDGAQFSDWEEVRGSGVQGRVAGEPARLGALRWLQSEGVETGAGKAFVEEWSALGATIVGLALGRRLEALFAVTDTLKAGAAAVVAQLQRQGIGTYLLTGDNALTAAGIARQVGIKPEHVFADVRPGQKSEFVQKLQQAGERVAFVGDGINDAPALEQADLGIAVSRASDIAREAADIILLKSEIEAVPESLGLARATLRTIKQNLFWAFFYNLLGIPLAALGFMSPVLCAAAMGLSDLVVIGNALRLRRWKFR